MREKTVVMDGYKGQVIQLEQALKEAHANQEKLKAELTLRTQRKKRGKKKTVVPDSEDDSEDGDNEMRSKLKTTEKALLDLQTQYQLDRQQQKTETKNMSNNLSALKNHHDHLQKAIHELRKLEAREVWSIRRNLPDA